MQQLRQDDIVWSIIYLQGLNIRPTICFTFQGCKFHIYQKFLSSEPCVIPCSTFLLHNFEFTPWTVLRYVTSEASIAMRIGTTTKQQIAPPLCVSLCSCEKHFWGVSDRHHAFPWQRNVLLTPHTTGNERQQNLPETVVNYCPGSFRPFPHSLKPDARSLTLPTTESWFRKRSFRHSCHFSGWSRRTCAIKSQSHPLAFGHVFLSRYDTTATLFPCAFLLLLLLAKPGKQNARWKFSRHKEKL